MKSVVVLGIRSGSSLITMMLDALGVYMGKEFRTATEFNEKGYWENRDFDKVNQAFFDHMGKDWRDNQPDYEDIMHIPFGVACKAKAVIEKHEREPIWGFKQPMTCFTLPIFQAWLKNPFYIIMSRNLKEQALSIYRMESASHPKLKVGDFERAVRGFMKSAVANTHGTKCLSLTYDEVLEYPEGVIKRVCEFLQIIPTKDQIKKAISFSVWS